MVQIDIKSLFGETAKLDELPAYEAAALTQAGDGQDVTLTGPGPVWLSLRLAHTLHGKGKSLRDASSVTDEVVIGSHNPF